MNQRVHFCDTTAEESHLWMISILRGESEPTPSNLSTPGESSLFWCRKHNLASLFFVKNKAPTDLISALMKSFFAEPQTAAGRATDVLTSSAKSEAFSSLFFFFLILWWILFVRERVFRRESLWILLPLTFQPSGTNIDCWWEQGFFFSSYALLFLPWHPSCYEIGLLGLLVFHTKSFWSYPEMRNM